MAGKAKIVNVLEVVIVSATAEAAGCVPTVTVIGPVAAPVGMVKEREPADEIAGMALMVPPPCLLSVTDGLGAKLVPLSVTKVPAGADLGLKSVMVGGAVVPGLTVNAFVRVACCVPVWIETLRGPEAAAALILSGAVAVVALVTVTAPNAPSAPVPTEMPAPKFAWVEPWTKLVNCPLIVTESVCPT